MSLIIVGCGSSDVPTNAGIENTATLSLKAELKLDFTAALLSARPGDLVLLDDRYLLVTEVDPVGRNIRLRWFEWNGEAIWHNIDRMVNPQFGIMGGFWQFNTKAWQKHICGYVDRTCP